MRANFCRLDHWDNALLVLPPTCLSCFISLIQGRTVWLECSETLSYFLCFPSLKFRQLRGVAERHELKRESQWTKDELGVSQTWIFNNLPFISSWIIGSINYLSIISSPKESFTRTADPKLGLVWQFYASRSFFHHLTLISAIMDQQQEYLPEARTPYQTPVAELTSSRIRSSLSLGRRL